MGLNAIGWRLTGTGTSPVSPARNTVRSLPPCSRIRASTICSTFERLAGQLARVGDARSEGSGPRTCEAYRQAGESGLFVYDWILHRGPYERNRQSHHSDPCERGRRRGSLQWSSDWPTSASSMPVRLTPKRFTGKNCRRTLDVVVVETFHCTRRSQGHENFSSIPVAGRVARDPSDRVVGRVAPELPVVHVGIGGAVSSGGDGHHGRRDAAKFARPRGNSRWGTVRGRDHRRRRRPFIGSDDHAHPRRICGSRGDARGASMFALLMGLQSVT